MSKVAKKGRYRRSALVCATWLASLSPEANAVECGDVPQNFAEAFHDAAFVFVGVAYKVEIRTGIEEVKGRSSKAGGSFLVSEDSEAKALGPVFEPLAADFMVLEQFKGQIENVPPIMFPSLAGAIRPTVGMSYLVFADKAGLVGVCGPTDESPGYMVKGSAERRKLELELAPLAAENKLAK